MDNIKEIKKILSGKTDKKVFIAPWAEKNIRKTDGDTWTDDEGKEWKKEDGVVKRINKFIDELTNIKICSRCGNKIVSYADEKMFLYHKQCLNCVSEIETEMRLNGTYEKYEKEKILNNKKAWLKDVKEELENIKSQFFGEHYVNSQGIIEDWQSDISKEQLCELLDKQYEELEKRILNF